MIRVLVSFCALTLASVQPALATTIIDTGGGGSSASRAGGWTLSGDGYVPYPNTIKWAAKFTLATPTIVTSLEAGMFLYVAGALDYQIYDAGSGLPETSTPLFTRHFMPTHTEYSGWTGPTDLTWRLTAGSYWFALSPPSGSTLFAALGQDPPHPAVAYADKPTGYDWRLQGATFDLRILGTQSAVPEPTGWTMLIVGFGLIGAERRMLRRRRILPSSPRPEGGSN